MKTEEVRFEIDKQKNLVIYLKDLLKKDSKELRFVILKEHLSKLKKVLEINEEIRAKFSEEMFKIEKFNSNHGNMYVNGKNYILASQAVKVLKEICGGGDD